MSLSIQNPLFSSKSLQKTQESDFLPYELATQYYYKWNCDIQIKQNSKGYFKCLEGKGEVQLKNGNIYKGSFYNGMMHGDNGEFIWKNGLKYKGNFYLNAITGQGEYKWPDESSYKGQLLNGKRHGKGDYYCAKDKSKYYGQFKNGVKHGYGMLEFNQDSFYQGSFHEGFRHGKGKMKYNSGNMYEGDWLNDKKNGSGIMNWFTENQKYEGQWKNDQQHGLGTYYWYDGKIQYKTIKNIYKGHWENGQRSGFGAFFFSNGRKYQGNFNNSCKNGFGVVMDQSGNMKLEYFQNNKLIYLIPESSGTNNLLVTKHDSSNVMVPYSKSKHLIEKDIKPSAQIIKQKIPQLSRIKSGPVIKKKSVKNSKLPAINTKKDSNNEQKSILMDERSQLQDNSILPDQMGQQKSFIMQPNNIIGSVQSKQNKASIEQNIYSKCLDFIECVNMQEISNKTDMLYPKIDKNIINLLLRQNSKLKRWYKLCCAYGNNSPVSSKDNYYTGLTIQNMWKLLKDIKVTDDYITIAKLNREFFKGWKSSYEIHLPSPKKLQLIKSYLLQIKQKHENTKQKINWDNLINNQKVNYRNIEWIAYSEQLMKRSQSDIIQFKGQIDLNCFNDIHNPKNIILFRNFVSYLLRLAFLQTQKVFSIIQGENLQKQFKNQIEKLFKSISVLFDTNIKDSRIFNNTITDNMSYVSKQKFNSIIPEDFNIINKQLFGELTQNQQCFDNIQDKTVTVKFVYQLLEKFNILKQVNQKMMFMEKIQRIFEVQNKLAGSIFKKDIKQHFPALEKVIHTSPYFTRLLNYPLIQRDFQQLVYQAINRKIHASSKQQAIKKYKQMIDSIKDFIRQQKNNKYLLESGNKPLFKLKQKKTEKDLIKQQLIRAFQQKKRLLEEQIMKKQQQKRQIIQQRLMNRQDFRLDDDEDSEQSQDYFL